MFLFEEHAQSIYTNRHSSTALAENMEQISVLGSFMLRLKRL